MDAPVDLCRWSAEKALKTAGILESGQFLVRRTKE
jgi:hypothetical protein